jgi:hypothetical protein
LERLNFNLEANSVAALAVEVGRIPSPESLLAEELVVRLAQLTVGRCLGRLCQRQLRLEV